MKRKGQTFQMWAVFNYDRPPIFIQMTRYEAKVKARDWVGGDKELAKRRRMGSITIEKVTVKRMPSATLSVKEKP